MSEPDQESVVIKAPPIGYALSGAVYLVAVVMGATKALPHWSAKDLLVFLRDPTRWASFILLTLALAAVWVWLSRFRVVLGRHRLTYRAPLQPERSINRHDIRNVEFVGPFAIKQFVKTIIIKGADLEAPISINTKPFRKRDINLILSFVKRSAD